MSRKHDRPITAVEDIDERKPWEAYYARNRGRISEVESMLTGAIARSDERHTSMLRRVGDGELALVEITKSVAATERVLIGVQATLGQLVSKFDGQGKASERAGDHRIRWAQLVFAALLGAGLSLITKGIKC